jgi:tRNA(Ile)-lysidine synthase
VEDVLAVCAGAKTTTALPKGWSAIRQDDQVRFEIGEESISDYEHAIGVPGSVDVQALGSSFEALLISDLSGYPAEHLFDAALLDKELVVRNWRAGDRFWPAHSKAPKKIKELLQERHITGSQRKLWPVVVSSDEVLWMRGFPRPQAWQCKPGATRAVLIREVAQGPSPQAYDSDRES